MSEHPPVTEEMVARGSRAYRELAGDSDSAEALSVESVVRGVLEAAQAVAPPKETADTKRPAFGTVRRVTANPESPIECVVVGDDVMLDSEWPPASRTRVRLVYPAASSPAAPPKEREQDTRDVGEAISALWTRIEARFWKGHEEGCAGRWDGEGEFDGCNCAHDSAASALEELAELAAASSPAAPATPSTGDGKMSEHITREDVRKLIRGHMAGALSDPAPDHLVDALIAHFGRGAPAAADPLHTLFAAPYVHDLRPLTRRAPNARLANVDAVPLA